MQQPLVSIIIPVYNSAKFLAAAVSAVQRQTYDNTEIIIIDDASTDNTYELAKTYESETCIVLRQNKAGAATARNLGLKNATGKYVQFLDVDDFLSEEKIEQQVKALDNQESKVAVCYYIEFFNEEELCLGNTSVDQSDFIYSSDSPADFLINLYGGNGKPNFIQTNSWLVPKALIEKVGGWRNYIWLDDDGEFFARVVLASSGVVYVPGVYNYYRRSTSESNLSNSTNKKYIQNALLSIDLKYEYLKQSTCGGNMNKAIATQYLHFAVYTYPKYKLISRMAYRRYKSIGATVAPPKLGGKCVEFTKYAFGWKIARLIRYYLRERST
ncbi:glycosyl transferase family 2 [Pontibacter ummariensis]|uniref:Glycosyl transferase family 2 n=1 Tax=Pontibacter ummariensis TaxID=1610492 RepID=A0A239BNH6_9BACT|nr:glycosyltransferase [Pontibacter ummariensis]PRY15752.1 glycosyl transferase family 2 [Pontibacter ummariensis]SNS08941.1 Glycosyl transferase family 2 [Pontibacter ummariensis]